MSGAAPNDDAPARDKPWWKGVVAWVAGIPSSIIVAVALAVIIPKLNSGDHGGPASASSAPASTARPTRDPSDDGVSPHVSATIYLNKDSGPAGTRVRVSGKGFDADEAVTVRFHVQIVAHTRTDAQGTFADVSARVPSDWRFSGQFMFFATGESSLKSAAREFQVT